MLRFMFVLLVSVVAIGAAHANEINIVNRSTATVSRIFIALEQATEWGDDRLGDDDTLSPGDSVTINLQSGAYEVQVVDEKEKECKIKASFLTSAGTWDITDNALRHCRGFGT